MSDNNTDRWTGDALSLVIDGAEQNIDITSASIENADADKTQRSFGDSMKPGGTPKKFTMKVSAFQRTAQSAFWTWVRKNQGVIVPYFFSLWGNTTPSVDQPIAEGTVKIDAYPTIGGDQSDDGSYQTFDVEFSIQEEPFWNEGTVTTPRVASVLPASKAVGDIVTITGGNFNGTTGVKFGNTAAKYTQSTDATITAVIPAGVTGATTVTVTNATGAGTAANYTAA